WASGIRVLLRGNGTERETRTDVDGLFAFRGLAGSTYQLEILEPGWIAAYNWNPLSKTVDLTSLSCSSTYFSLKQEQAAIHGRITGLPGVSLLGIPVSAVPKDDSSGSRNQRTARTKANGEFTIAELEPGEYVAGLN